MKKKRAGRITLTSLKASVDKQGDSLGEFRGTLGEFRGTLDEFRGTLGDFRGSLEGFKEEFGAFKMEMTSMLGFVIEHMATKDDVFVLQTQINGIESNIREMKQSRLEVRVADLEEKVFGETR